MNIRIGFFSLSLLLTFHVTAQQMVTVEDATMMAVERSFNVLFQKNAVDQSNVNARNSVGLFLPDVTLTGSRTWNRNNSRQTLADNSEVDRPNIRQNNFNAQAQLVWTLFDGLSMFATYKGMQENASANEILLKEEVGIAMASVISNYHNIVAQKQRLKALNEQISIGDERVKLAERKLQVGSGAKTELLQARLDQNAFKTQALQQEALIIQTKANLNVATGMQLPDEFEVADTILLNLDLKLEDILNGIESANPALIASRGFIESAKFLVKSRRGQRLPIINFVSGYNFQRNESNQAQNQFSPIATRTNGFNYGFTASWPILNSLITNTNIQLASIELERQKLLYEQQRVTIFAGAKIAYANYDNARKTLAVEEENIGYARENVFIALESFKRGVATFIELRTAQQSIIDAYNRLTTARFNAKVSETELLRLKGALVR